MRYIITIIITALITSCLWLIAFSLVKIDTPINDFIYNYKYEKIKMEKEMELKAEMEIAREKEEQLKNYYRDLIEGINQDLHSANTKGYANDIEGAMSILDEAEKKIQEVLKSGYYYYEGNVMLKKLKETEKIILGF